MAGHDLEEPLESLASALDDILIEAIGEHFPR